MARIRGKRLTVDQKADVMLSGISIEEVNDWLLQKVVYKQNGSNKNLSKLAGNTETYLQIVHRETGEVREILKEYD